MRAPATIACILALTLLAMVTMVRVRVVDPGTIERRAGQPGSDVTRPGAGQPVGPLAIPVANVAKGTLADNWGDPRENGLRAHYGTDIAAPPGTPVLAAASGVVEKLHVSDAGGTTAYVRSPDRRWSYYYAHLKAYVAGLREGQAIRKGQVIGFVGDTGNAGAGNYHLHFGVSRMAPQDGWWQGRPIDPYPLLAGKAAHR